VVVKRTEGKRQDIDAEHPLLKPGEYGKDEQENWCFAVPDEEWIDGWGKMGGLDNHTVVEHADGTITVSPSILCGLGEGRSWHGYLRAGVFEEI